MQNRAELSHDDIHVRLEAALVYLSFTRSCSSSLSDGWTSNLTESIQTSGATALGGGTRERAPKRHKPLARASLDHLIPKQSEGDRC